MSATVQELDMPPATGSPVTRDDAPVGREVPLPRLRTMLSPEEVLERASFASRRGRLAGFEPGGAGLFSVAAFGQPFDRVLIVEAQRDGPATVLRFSTRLLRKWPALFIAVAVFTVWPGVWLTHSLLQTYFPGSLVANWPYWWYLPLSVLPLPWAAKSM